MNFSKGLKHGLPIALGYCSTAFAFGVLAIQHGFDFWVPLLISVTNFTGTGQFVGIEIMAAGGAILELLLTMCIINLRYTLMSISLSQKLNTAITLPQRLLIAFGNTDEIYAVSMRQSGALTFRYLLGLMVCAYSGWVLGTVFGALAGNIFPPAVMHAFGIALYAMFLAIIVPVARENRQVAVVVLMALAVSCLFYFIPFLQMVSNGYVIIICAISVSALAAWLFPVRETEFEKTLQTKEQPK